MKTTVKKFWLLLAPLVAVIGVMAVNAPRSGRDGAEQAAVRVTAPVAVSVVVAPAPAVQSVHVTQEPSVLAGFSSAAVPERLERVARLASDTRWPESVRSWLFQHIQERGGDPTVRNNIANGLLAQDGADAQALQRLFTAMAADLREDEVWRAYAIQHLTSTVEIGADAGAVLSDLIGFTRDRSGVVAGTALMQLARLEADGRVQARSSLVQAALARLAMPPEDRHGRMAAVAVLGDLRAAEGAPPIRAVVGEPALRRVAIAALGRIGDAADRDLLQAAASDGDPLVAKAAAVALGQPPFADVPPTAPH